MTAMIEPHIPALKHVFPSMTTSSSRFSRILFFYCAKTYFTDSLDHLLNVCLSFLKIDHCLFLIEAHISLLYSVKPLQGSPHDRRASPSCHSLNPESHCFETAWLTRADA